jgi:hypothetical protein
MNNTQEFTSETLSYLKAQIMTGNFYETLNEFGYSIFQYVLGSLVFGLLLGLITLLVSYVILKIVAVMKKERIV